MAEKIENARVDVGASQRATEKRVPDRDAAIPAPNYSEENQTRQQFFIESLLPQGSENAISAQDLLNLTGISSKRLLQSIISEERVAGGVILSRSDGGYFRPSANKATAEKEIAAFVHTLEARAKNTLRILRSSKRALKYAQIEHVGGLDM